MQFGCESLVHLFHVHRCMLMRETSVQSCLLTVSNESDRLSQPTFLTITPTPLPAHKMFAHSYHGYTPSSAEQFIHTKIGQRVPATQRSQSSLQIRRRAMKSAPASQSVQPLLRKAKNVPTMYNQTFADYSSQNRASTAGSNSLQKTNKENSGLAGQRKPVRVCHENYRSNYRSTHVEDPLAQPSRWNKNETHPERRKQGNSQHRVKFRSASAMSTAHQDFKDPLSIMDSKFNVDDKSTTMDLQYGTAKASGHISGGFTGHVPAHPSNRAKMFDRGGRPDPKRMGLRDQLRHTVSSNLPGYTGFQPSSTKNFLGRMLSHEKKTENEIAHCELPVNPYNTREFGNSSTTVQQFFTHAANTSSDGLADAQKYFNRIRPLEGQIKLGAKTERGWVADNVLKRSFIE
mmetsp:Transcript_10897/g.40630  ORF Transcript_10897/g.40630 Transcript_10897/m.40630 type:complete len:403 (+) Transcript_10897:2295-3503(+)